MRTPTYNQMYNSDLTDSQWQAIKLLLPAKIWQRKRKQPIRAIINGILYVVKSDRRSGRYLLVTDAQ